MGEEYVPAQGRAREDTSGSRRRWPWSRRERDTAAKPKSIADLPSDFDPAVYLQLNPDVAAAGHEPCDHYRQHGHGERRPYRLG
jgi:hypothetical protein